MKKITFYSEAAYFAAILFLAAGTALMEKAKLGLSMVIAPAYLIYVKLSETHTFMTFGKAEYIFQLFILLIVSLILKRFKFSYLFSFITVIFYGFCLDFCITIFKAIPATPVFARIILFTAGLFLGSAGIAFMFKTYITPAAYEVFVKEISEKMKINIYRFKILYDFSSCIVSIALSFIFFGWFKFIGIHIGTVICAITGGVLISFFGNLYDKIFVFKDGLNLRDFFK